jgi:hypothetical protein
MGQINEKPAGGKKGVIFGGIIIVAIAIAIVAYVSYPPNEEDMQGTIGASDRYRAEQMTDESVILDDPDVQKLLQDDQFLALLENEDFKKMMEDQSFAKIVGSPEFVNLIQIADFKESLGNATM